MTRVTKPRRGGRGAKRINPADLRAIVGDNRMWCSLGVVTESSEDQDSDYYELIPGSDGQLKDVLIEVLLVPSNIPITARLKGIAQGIGVITIPSLGDEVIVDIPDAAVDWMPSIVAVLSTGSIPNPDGQGPAPRRVLIVADDVLVHDGSGGAEPLVRKSEFDAHREWAEAHRHAGLLGGTGSVAGLTSPPATGLPPYSGGSSDPPPEIEGTPVLRA